MRTGTRCWVDGFAREMEAKLSENRHKGDRAGWSKLEPAVLLEMLRAEVDELEDAVFKVRHAQVNPTRPEEFVRVLRREVVREAADVGNIAMMLADVVGWMRAKKKVAAPRRLL